MPIKTIEVAPQKEQILFLNKEASAALNERRDEQRHPFFRTVSIQILELGDVVIEAFCKDISLSGMGVLTNLPLPTPIKVSLTLEDKLGQQVTLMGEVVRTDYCGKNWYSSGIKFFA